MLTVTPVTRTYPSRGACMHFWLESQRASRTQCHPRTRTRPAARPTSTSSRSCSSAAGAFRAWSRLARRGGPAALRRPGPARQRADAAARRPRGTATQIGQKSMPVTVADRAVSRPDDHVDADHDCPAAQPASAPPGPARWPPLWLPPRAHGRRRRGRAARPGASIARAGRSAAGPRSACSQLPSVWRGARSASEPLIELVQGQPALGVRVRRAAPRRPRGRRRRRASTGAASAPPGTTTA